MKKWYLSKTLWVNLISLIALVVQGVSGHAWLDAETQVTLLTLINIILRIVTKEELNWK